MKRLRDDEDADAAVVVKQEQPRSPPLHQHLVVFVMLTIMHSLALVVFELASDGDGSYRFSPASALVLTELAKLVLATAIHLSELRVAVVDEDDGNEVDFRFVTRLCCRLMTRPAAALVESFRQTASARVWAASIVVAALYAVNNLLSYFLVPRTNPASVAIAKAAGARGYRPANLLVCAVLTPLLWLAVPYLCALFLRAIGLPLSELQWSCIVLQCVGVAVADNPSSTTTTTTTTTTTLSCDPSDAIYAGGNASNAASNASDVTAGGGGVVGGSISTGSDSFSIVDSFSVNGTSYGAGGSDDTLFVHGMLLVSVCVTATSSLVNDRIVKRFDGVPLQQINMIMYAFGVVFALASYYAIPAYRESRGEFFEGFDAMTVLLITVQALYGLAVSFAYKHSDVLVKNLSSSATLAVLVGVDAIFFDTRLTFDSVAGVVVIVVTSRLYLRRGVIEGAPPLPPATHASQPLRSSVGQDPPS